MFITKKHISRRTVLKGAGAALALPFLDSMIPAATAQSSAAASAAARPQRFVGIFTPHGMAPGYWVPSKEGTDFEYPYCWKPLEPFRDQVTLMSGLHSTSAEPPPGVTGADHWVAAAFLCADKPKKTAGADVRAGTNTIAWASPTKPLPMELNPQVVFERMFGDGASPEERTARRERNLSILDSLNPKISGLRKEFGPTDRSRLDDYAENIREIERRLELARTASKVAPENLDVPVGIPSSFDLHIKLQFDLLALAFRADITRVGTLLVGRDLTNRTYPDSEVPRLSFHGGSHHGEDPARIADFSKLNQYHVKMVAHLADSLKKVNDGDGTLLDHSVVLFGSNMGNPNQHLHYDVPHALIGGASGKLKGGRHLAYPSKKIPTGNLLLSLLDLFDIHQESIGDSTGRLDKLV
jgi:hypothetical protein